MKLVKELALLALGAAALVYLMFGCGVITRGQAHDWTGQNLESLADWFSSLRREVDHMSCCGLGDAYPARILIEADPNKPFEDTGVAEITDGRALSMMDGGAQRVALPFGTLIKFSYYKVTSQHDGNPTNTAWVFLSAYENHMGPGGSNEVGQVYCVVPLPPSM